MKNTGQKTEIQIHPCKNWPKEDTTSLHKISSLTSHTVSAVNSIAAPRNLKLTPIILNSDISGARAELESKHFRKHN